MRDTIDSPGAVVVHFGDTSSSIYQIVIPKAVLTNALFTFCILCNGVLEVA